MDEALDNALALAGMGDLARPRSWLPAANLDSFDLALVITDYDGGLPPVDDQPVPCGEEGALPEGEVQCYTPNRPPRSRPAPR